jgi:glutaredoxin
MKHQLTLYSRPDCHLCDDMETTIQNFSKKNSVDLRIVDISNNATLETQYGQEIPVLFIDGRKVAKYRVSEQELQKALIADYR